MAAEIEAFSGPDDAAGFERFCHWLTELYELEMPHFIDTNFDSPLDLARPLAPALRLVRMGGFRRLDRVVRSYFRDERLRRIFSFQSMYAGLAPYEALALYAVITYMDAVEGVYAPEGGMHRLAEGLAGAVEKAGARIRYGAPVGRILRAGSGAVTGVELVEGEDRERLAADAVVCNADLPVAYRQLLGGVEAPRAARRGTYSPSCVLWVAGVRGDPPAGSEHHNLHFGADWNGAFRAVIEDGTLMPDPSILVTVPSRDDAGAGPGGFVVPVRAGTGAQPGRPGRLGAGAGSGPGRAGRTGGGARAIPSMSSWSASMTRSTGRRPGWSGAHRSRWPTPSGRRGRSGRPTSTAASPASCSSGPAPCPGSGCRWC